MTHVNEETVKDKPLRRIHFIVLGYLDHHGDTVRDKMARDLERPRTTVYDALRFLELKGMVCRRKIPRNTRGRPLVAWGCTDAEKCQEGDES